MSSKTREEIARIVFNAVATNSIPMRPSEWESVIEQYKGLPEPIRQAYAAIGSALEAADAILALPAFSSGGELEGCLPSPAAPQESSMAAQASRYVAPPSLPGQVVAIDYTNWRGERSIRRIVPNMESLWYGFNDWHRDAQWLLDAYDVEKGDIRTFAMKDIHSWSPAHSVSDEHPTGEDRNGLSAQYASAQRSWTPDSCFECWTPLPDTKICPTCNPDLPQTEGEGV